MGGALATFPAGGSGWLLLSLLACAALFSGVAFEMALLALFGGFPTGRILP